MVCEDCSDWILLSHIVQGAITWDYFLLYRLCSFYLKCCLGSIKVFFMCLVDVPSKIMFDRHTWLFCLSAILIKK